MNWVNAFRHASIDSFPPELIRKQREKRTWSADELELPREMNGSGPLVSVVIPTYEDDEYLPDALESISAQSYTNIEVVIVDSSGVSWLKEMAEERDWINHYQTKPDGISAARNTGIKNASGEIIALLDADDYWHPDKLEKQIVAIQNGSDVVYSDSYHIDIRKDGYAKITYMDGSVESKEQAYRERALGSTRILTSSLIFRKSILGAKPFNENFNYREDELFMVDLFKKSSPEHISEPLIIRRRRDGSVSDLDLHRRYQNAIEVKTYLSDKFPEMEKELLEELSCILTSYGVSTLKSGYKIEARKMFKQSIYYSKTNKRGLILYLLTFLPIKSGKIYSTSRRLKNLVQGESSPTSIKNTEIIEFG